jgi:GTP-binding protein
MIPIIALVGRPNVGKSTLFNRLTRTRDAIVSDFSGLTRDRQYGRAMYGQLPFIVIDTGGVEGQETGIEALALKQTEQAIAEADCVVFIVDAKGGITSGDQLLAHKVRISQKPVILLANKIDKANAEVAPAEFFQLALGDPLGISAAHNRGVNGFLEHLFETLAVAYPKPESELSEEEQQELHTRDLSIRIAIIGKPNVGKSTLVNRMLGEERVIVYDQPGTTRDSIYVPMERHGQHYTLIDTAGIRRKSRTHETIEKFSIIKSLQAIDEANVVIIVIDGKENVTDQDLHLLGYALESGRSLMIAINKWDDMDHEARLHVKAELARKLVFVSFAKIHYISALHGTGVGLLFDTIDRVYESATRKHSTNHLTRILMKALEDHAPPHVGGRRIKLKYAHSGGHNPPIIVIHGNQADSLPKDYQRYLMSVFRKELKLEGTPIRLEMKTTDNPFKDVRNVLTEGQARSRQRVIGRAKEQKKRRQQKR